MKPEAEVRKHRDDLLACLAKSCCCGERGCGVECYIGGRMMEAVADALSWVLGEAPHRDGLVEEMAAGARRL